MRASPRLVHQHQAFTLIELLVVVAIIIIIVGMFFPVLGAIQNSGRKTQATHDEHSLMTAVFAYMGDYNNQLPVNQGQMDGAKMDNGTGSGAGYDTVYGDPGPKAMFPNYLLMDILRGIADDKNQNNIINPTKTMYFDEPYTKNQTEPRSGLLKVSYNDGSYTMQPGTFVDPWGSEYLIWLDVCRDGNLNDGMTWFYSAWPKDTDASKPKYGPFGTVQIGSLGPDGNFGKNGLPDGSDDILLLQ